jgi:hypothetical protein
MKFNFAGVAAVAFALATAPAFALPGKSLQPFVGDGSNSVPVPGPYYSGTGSAYLGDGSDAGPAPGPSYAPASAQVGDGSNATPAPGPYYNGTGNAEKNSAQYDQDGAQPRAHSHAEGQY